MKSNYLIPSAFLLATFLFGLLFPFGLSTQEMQADFLHGIGTLFIGALVLALFFVFIRTPHRLHAEHESRIKELRRDLVLMRSWALGDFGANAPLMTGSRVLQYFERNSDDPAISKIEIEMVLTDLAKKGRIVVRGFPLDSDKMVVVDPGEFESLTFNLVADQDYLKRKLGSNADDSIIGGRICPIGQPTVTVYDAPLFATERIENVLPRLVGANRKTRRDKLRPSPDWSFESAEAHLRSFYKDYQYRGFGLGMSRERTALIDAVREGAVTAWMIQRPSGIPVEVDSANFSIAFPSRFDYVPPPSTVDKIIQGQLSGENDPPEIKFSERDIKDYWPVG